MTNELIREYYIAKYIYLSNLLCSVPKISFGHHGKNKVLRDYEHPTNKKPFSEYLIDSKKSLSILKDAENYSNIKKELTRIKQILNVNICCSHYKINPMVHNVLPISIKKHLSPCMNNSDNNYEYTHKGIKMKSRFEVNIAIILDNLHLEYYYEPKIIINGKTFYPDFIVFLPELGYCFIIECLGMTDDIDYLYRNNSKFVSYLHIGLEINKNLLYFCGTGKYIPPIEYVMADIVNLINNLTRSTFSYNI